MKHCINCKIIYLFKQADETSFRPTKKVKVDKESQV